VVLVAVSPRIPPGLLSWPAWEALRSGPVRTADGTSPQLPFLRDAGVDVAVEQPDVEALHARALAGQNPVWFAPDAALVRAVGQRSVAGGAPVELVHGSYDPPGARLLDVVAVMDRLRSPGGCPWDAEQTHTEPHAVPARGGVRGVRRAGGRRPVRPARGARRRPAAGRLPRPAGRGGAGGGSAVVDRRRRRRPRRQARPPAPARVRRQPPADDLEGTWEALKQAEKGRTSVTDGVPLSQPALSLAADAAEAGHAARGPGAGLRRLGGELWELVRRCRDAGLDPEVPCGTTARAYRDRLAAAEAAVLAAGLEPAALTPEQWEQQWA
jgi:XTP/dITP diphosphohydrolase